MIAIGLRFTAGRYHATPWGRHVNEGAPEWPPSPWRLLRALVAVWKSKLDGVLPQARVEPILRALAPAPAFRLPPAGYGHSRHYMPWFKKGPGDKTLVFDAFVALAKPSDGNGSVRAVDEGELLALWPDADLASEALADLALLLTNLNFLGRSEAWCDARLLDLSETAALPDSALNCQPLVAGRPAVPDTEPVRVLCADPTGAFKSAQTPKIRREEGTGRNKQVFADPLYDPDWHLCAETLWLHEKKWSSPPGSQWVTYARRRDCFKVNPTPTPRQPAAGTRPAFQVARFALDSSVLPLVTQTLPVAESARRTLMGVHGRLHPVPGSKHGRPSALFSGKDAAGEPLTGHAHAFFLPTDEDGDGRLDHLTVVANAGFGPGELRALDELRRLADRERDDAGHPLRVLLLGLGRLDGDLPAPLKPSSVWISATPFVATRFPKTQDRRSGEPLDVAAFLEKLLRQELQFLFDSRPEHFAGFDPQNVTVLPKRDPNGVFRLPDPLRRWEPVGCRPLQFQRFRQKREDDGGRRHSGYFEIDFGRKVPGPITLGHSSHFGLGLFLPVSDKF